MTNSANNEQSRGDCQVDWQDDTMQERLSAFIDGELPVDEFEEIRQHVGSCLSCSRAVDQFRKVDNQLFQAMSRPQVLRPVATAIHVDKPDSPRDLTLPNASPSRHWLATGTLAAAGVALLAAFASGMFSSGKGAAETKNSLGENPFTQAYMTRVVAPLGDMALSNDVCKSQQKHMARTLDLELRLLRLDTRHFLNEDDEVKRINEEIESLIKQVQELGDSADTPSGDFPAL